RDRARDRARLPVRLLAVALRSAPAADAAARAGDRPLLVELPASRLLVADHPRPEGRDQPLPAMGRHHAPPARRPPLRPAGGDPRARLPLLSVRRAHALLVDRALRLEPAPGGDGPRRVAAAGDLPHPGAADPTGDH